MVIVDFGLSGRPQRKLAARGDAGDPQSLWRGIRAGATLYARVGTLEIPQTPAKLPRMRVRHLFLSAGHNFYGRMGQPPGEHPINEVDAVECVAGRGLRGDRFFDYKDNYKGQVTFFSWEVFNDLRRELQLFEAQPWAMRRNVITQGVNLMELVGKPFELQGVRFEGVEECRPCEWMDVALGAGAEAWLRGKGGLRARILTDGWLRKQASEEPAARRLVANDWPENELG
ncbi:MOSC domain-containing protein [Nibricoccus sp. IMCC34717]|uniref:MOSC domain-containing protein n=1 Tax=Nibricoccus sp. IMCC34717 TaxID=3034021 RepID=UPI0038510DCE